MKLKFGTQGIHHPLDTSLTRLTLIVAALAQFNEDNYFVFTVLYDTVKYSSGKSIQNDYLSKDTPDGQAALLALAKDATLSAVASQPAAQLEAKLRALNPSPQQWGKSKEQFLLHWMNLLNKLEEVERTVSSCRSYR